jgi:hypothetical protein
MDMSRRTFFEIAEPLLGLLALGIFLAVLLLSGCDLPGPRGGAASARPAQGATFSASAQRAGEVLTASTVGAGS